VKISHKLHITHKICVQQMHLGNSNHHLWHTPLLLQQYISKSSSSQPPSTHGLSLRWLCWESSYLPDVQKGTASEEWSTTGTEGSLTVLNETSLEDKHPKIKASGPPGWGLCWVLVSPSHKTLVYS